MVGEQEKEKRNANKEWHNCDKQQLGALKRPIGNTLGVLGWIQFFKKFWRKEPPRDLKGIKLMLEDARAVKKYVGDIVGIVVRIFILFYVFFNHKGCYGH
jgi:magnesium-transporting ATPase (P-type)